MFWQAVFGRLSHLRQLAKVVVLEDLMVRSVSTWMPRALAGLHGQGLEGVADRPPQLSLVYEER
ncbi:hypothetical protein [Streptomyces chartreusis]|uniref:hypothetical protein n=1 Tax=Streptomyces chartreusis TaxID=1969 RepID=UPI0036BA013F